MSTTEVAYVSIREAAKILGISRQRVQELIKDRKLPAIKLGNTVWMIRESDVLARFRDKAAL